MGKIARHLINFYLYSSLHIGLCCGCIYLFSIDRFGIPMDRNYLAFIISSTIFTYSIHRLIGMNKVKQFEHKGRYAVISRFKYHIITYSIISGITCLYLFYTFDTMRMVMLAVAGLISIAYTLPIFGRQKRLRDFSLIKIFLIAIVWAFVTESIPLMEQAVPYTIIIFLFLSRVLFFIAITVPFDVRDMEVDLSNDVKTIPIKMGKNKALFLSLLMIVGSIMIELCLDTAYGINHSSSVIIAYFISGVLIYNSGNKKSDYYYTGLLDGTIMLPYLIVQIIHLVTA